MKASKGTIFVPYPVLKEDGTEKRCSKANFVKEANEQGANIRTMSFEDFLAIFNLTEAQLDELPMVSFDCLCREGAIIKYRKTASIVKAKKNADVAKVLKEDKKKHDTTTLGELFGDFFDKFNDDGE